VAKYTGLSTNYSRASLFQSLGPRAALGSFGKDSAQSLRRLGFVWPKCSALSRLSRVRLAKRRVVHVQTLFSLSFCPLASFAEVGFVCGKCQRRSRSRTKPVSSAQDRRHNNLLTSHAKNKSPAQQAAPGFDHSSEGRSFMHESRFICKENLFRALPAHTESLSSLPGLSRQSILLARRWMRGSSPRMTRRGLVQFERDLQDGHKRDRASGHPSRRSARKAARRAPQDEAFETGACRHAPSSG
jgi:hypothetical protein